MPGSSEQLYSASSDEQEKEGGFYDEQNLPIEIPQETWKVIEHIAKRVAGDFNLTVKVGPPYLERVNPLTGEMERVPYTALANIQDNCLIFNPFFIAEHPEWAFMFAAHEGAHRAITRLPHQIGVPLDLVKRMQGSDFLGFHSFWNIGLEDPRVDSWVTQRLPALLPIFKKMYDESLAPDGILVTPEIFLFITKLGRTPRYVEVATELVRFWHTGKYSENLKPEIKQCLAQIQQLVTEYHETIPSVDSHLQEREVVQKARRCFELYYRHIWPEVKKLVEMDLVAERNRQVLTRFVHLQKRLQQASLDLQAAQQRGDIQAQEKLREEINDLKRELVPFEDLPEDVKRELAEHIECAMQKLLRVLKENIQVKQAQINNSLRTQTRIQEELSQLRQSLTSRADQDAAIAEETARERREGKRMGERQHLQPSATQLKVRGAEEAALQEQGAGGGEDEKHRLRKEYGSAQDVLKQEEGGEVQKLQDLQRKQLLQEMILQQQKEELAELQNALSGIQSGREVPYPEDRFSEQVKRELEKLFEKLPSHIQKEIRELSRRVFAALEDAIKRATEGKLTEDSSKEGRVAQKECLQAPDTQHVTQDAQQTPRVSQGQESGKRYASLSGRSREDRRRIEAALDRLRMLHMTPYERMRREVQPIIDDLYHRLRKILAPQADGFRTEDGFPSGFAPNMARLMQAERDPTQYRRMWTRESALEKKERFYHFIHLVDVSGSMAGDKIVETIKGLIVVVEALERLQRLFVSGTIQQGIIGFHKCVFPVKEMNKPLNREVQRKLLFLEELTHDASASTNTYAGTIAAIKRLEQAARRRVGLRNTEGMSFLLTFSDGMPNADAGALLRDFLKTGKKGRKKTGIRVGLIWLGDPISEDSLTKKVDGYGYDFGLQLPTVNPSEKSNKFVFSKRLADLMEDLIKHSDRY